MFDTQRRRKFTAPVTDRGSLPTAPGTVLGRVPMQEVRGQQDLTEAEREIIEKAGWHPGDPVPDFRGTKVGQHLTEQIAKVKEIAEDHFGLCPVDPSTPPLDAPEPVDVEDMTPEEQAKAMQIFQEMDELQDRMDAAKHQPIPPALTPQLAAVPGAAAAIATATAAVQQLAPSVQLVDDIGVTNGPKQQSPFTLKKQPEPPKQAAPQPAEISSDDQISEEGAGADLRNAAVVCPRCAFDLNSELITPTTEDIVAYLAALTEGKRFRKTVVLFGGRITLVFRGLLPKEVDAALELADRDLKNGEISHVLQYARRAESYKLAMGIESVVRQGHGPINMPVLDDMDESAGGKSPILQLRDYLDNDVFTVDSVRRAVGGQWVRFNHLLQYMEAKAEDPDFFDVTG